MVFFRNFLVSVFAHRAGMLLSFARAGSKKSLARRSQSAVLCLQRAVVCSAAVVLCVLQLSGRSVRLRAKERALCRCGR